MAYFKITQNKKGELQAKIQVSGKDLSTGKSKVFTKRVYNTDELTEAKFRKQVEKTAIAFEEEVSRAYQDGKTQLRSKVLTFAELNEHSHPEEVEGLLKPLLSEGKNIGLMSEAGLPCVADPGAWLVAAAHRHGVEVVPLVGPSSIMLALMASGANGQSFAFNGYLPVKPAERVKAIRAFERRIAAEGQSQIFIEAPYRNRKLFEDILTACAPQTRLCVACDVLEPGQLIGSKSVAEWKKSGAPAFDKRPAIFILF